MNEQARRPVHRRAAGIARLELRLIRRTAAAAGVAGAAMRLFG